MSTSTPSSAGVADSTSGKPEIRVMIVSPRNLGTLDAVADEVAVLDDRDD